MSDLIGNLTTTKLRENADLPKAPAAKSIQNDGATLPDYLYYIQTALSSASDVCAIASLWGENENCDMSATQNSSGSQVPSSLRADKINPLLQKHAEKVKVS